MQRRKKEPRGRVSRQEISGWERLEDSNEQEQEKSGIPNMREEEELVPEKEMPNFSENIARQPEKNEQPSPVDRAVALPPPPPCRKDGQAIEKREEEETAWVGKEKTDDDKPTKKKKKESSSSPRLWGVILTAVLLISLAILFMALTVGNRYAEEGQTEPKGPSVDSDVSVGGEKVVFIRQYEEGSGLLTTAELYAQCADSVVSILAESKTGTGVGSGFFLSEDGYIGTANHVIEGMETLTAVLSDGTRYSAVKVAGNAMTDLAVLKIEGDGFDAVEFGESDSLLTGEKVIAIGTPASLDYAGSVCTGEVSYGKRTVRIYRDSTGALEKKMKLIQTDAPVNPGNSGCPLFDEYGRVVGVITMKLGNRYAGIGFAIPSDGALPIYRAMIAGEELTAELLSAVSVSAPRLGIAGESARENGVYGVRILRFTDENTDISLALHSGDLIVEIDGKAITSVADISAVIHEKEPKDAILITVLRDGQRLSFEVPLL